MIALRHRKCYYLYKRRFWSLVYLLRDVLRFFRGGSYIIKWQFQQLSG